MSSEAIQAIDRNIKQAKAVIEFGNALERLLNNKDFKKVVLEGYFEREAVRLVHLKSDQNMQSPDSQRSIVSQMDAIGNLRSFFDTALHSTRLASKAVDADEETREELLAEELNNG
jgi:hypothetical protein